MVFLGSDVNSHIQTKKGKCHMIPYDKTMQIDTGPIECTDCCKAQRQVIQMCE